MIDNIYYNYFLLLFFAAELQSGIPCRGRPKIYKIRSVIPPIKRGPLSGKGIKQLLCALCVSAVIFFEKLTIKKATFRIVDFRVYL